MRGFYISFNLIFLVLFFFFIYEAKKKKSTKRKRKHVLFPMSFGHHKGCASHNLLRSLLCLTGTRSQLTPHPTPLLLGEEKQAFFGRKMQQQVFFLSYPTFFLFSSSKKKECWCGVRGGISPDKLFTILCKVI